MRKSLVRARLAAVAVAAALALPGASAWAAPVRPKPAAAVPAATEQTRIAAVVNGDVISNVDVENRARLFAMSTGLPLTPEVLDRLKPQMLHQLVDERVRLQEIERRHIVVPDKQIAAAIREIEARNGMPAGALMARLKKAGISPLTLIDQIRAQLGWTLVLRQELGEQARITDSEVAARQRALQQDVGKPEYRVGEIFIPIDSPSGRADAQHFAETVIKELRAGASFPLVAAQFSQSQSALHGGELGWVQPNQLDPEVAKLVQQMPVGAISNPIPVPGGLTIATLQGKRLIGRDMATILSVRQDFLPFSTTLNPQDPTAQQRAQLDKARHISQTVHSCAQMEQQAKDDHSPRPVDPGPVRLETVNPPVFRQLLGTIPIGQPTKPLVAVDGIVVMAVCSREQKNLADENAQQVREQLLAERVDNASRQLQHELQRRAQISIRQGST
ncbi:MAG TPA: peptidylprolyl isomerase [Acetobacteraceae bacterium]|nr:peptidylprolyl isomerase [Acetobacteraceae bacterium]